MPKKGTLSLKNNGFVLMMSSIMAGDSPSTGHKENLFNDESQGRSTPPPTTSYSVAAGRPETEVVQPKDASVLGEPMKDEKEKEKEKDDQEFSKPDANPGFKPEDGKKSEGKTDSSRDSGGGGDKKSSGDKKVNGADTLDGQWVPSSDKKVDNDDESEKEESCVVNCLYYTLQCCECTIS